MGEQEKGKQKAGEKETGRWVGRRSYRKAPEGPTHLSHTAGSEFKIGFSFPLTDKPKLQETQWQCWGRAVFPTVNSAARAGRERFRRFPKPQELKNHIPHHLPSRRRNRPRLRVQTRRSADSAFCARARWASAGSQRKSTFPRQRTPPLDPCSFQF